MGAEGVRGMDWEVGWGGLGRDEGIDQKERVEIEKIGSLVALGGRCYFAIDSWTFALLILGYLLCMRWNAFAWTSLSFGHIRTKAKVYWHEFSVDYRVGKQLLNNRNQLIPC